jgi:hypothetical protein
MLKKSVYFLICEIKILNFKRSNYNFRENTTKSYFVFLNLQTDESSQFGFPQIAMQEFL